MSVIGCHFFLLAPWDSWYLTFFKWCKWWRVFIWDFRAPLQVVVISQDYCIFTPYHNISMVYSSYISPCPKSCCFPFQRMHRVCFDVRVVEHIGCSIIIICPVMKSEGFISVVAKLPCSRFHIFMFISLIIYNLHKMSKIICRRLILCWMRSSVCPVYVCVCMLSLYLVTPKQNENPRPSLWASPAEKSHKNCSSSYLSIPTLILVQRYFIGNAQKLACNTYFF